MKRILPFIFLFSILNAKDLTKELDKLIEKRKLDQAENLIYQAQAEGEFSPILQIYLAKVYFLKKQYKNAYETLMGIEKPQDPETKSKLLSFLLEFGDSVLKVKYRDMALNIYFKIYTIDSTYSLGLRSKPLADFMMDQGDYETAKKLYEKFVFEGGNPEEIVANYVKCLYMLGKWNEIVKYQQKIEKLKEDAELQFILGETYFYLAKRYYDAGIPDSALTYLNRLIVRESPKIYLDDAYYLKGEILYEFGDIKGALECYYKALSLAPPRSVIARKAKERIDAIERQKY